MNNLHPHTRFSCRSAVVLIAFSSFVCLAADTKVFPGASEQTPSRAHYFSWINNAWEGSTEAQTLINLEFFQWLHDEYGMQLDCYAFDAGNLDTQGEYGSTDSPKFKAKFPEGFGRIAAKAKTVGCRLGMWAGPDGFGDTPEQEQRRIDMMVRLCRDDQFALLKLDACASNLRPEKQDAFIRMMEACRKFQPDLIVLNHRIELGKALPYATTFLFEGAETYIDVHMSNEALPGKTATHNRGGALARKLVPGLKRLTEDHGVCLSSCLDYWDDDLILQAFNRCLILAPEIYGNPWLLRDDEFPRLARIYNLHRHYRNILVNGMTLPQQDYGPCAVSRGDGQTRFLTLRNLTWLPVKYKVALDSSIGLDGSGPVELRQFHPTERILGQFAFGSQAEIEVFPFRACLVAASIRPLDELGVIGCDYAVVRDVRGKPAVLKLMGMPGETNSVKLAMAGRTFTTASLDGQTVNGLLKGDALKISFPGRTPKGAWHRKLGDLRSLAVPADAEGLYEATCFAADNNALEVRSLARSGPTHVSQVQAARDAFFTHPIFVEKGIWDRNLFDGRMETRFNQAPAWGGKPKNGGALRVDFGAAVHIDRLLLRGEGIQMPKEMQRELAAEVSSDLKTWQPTKISLQQNSISVDVPDRGPVRYFRMNAVPAPLAEVEGYHGSNALDRMQWRASNLFSPYAKAPASAAWSLSVKLDEVLPGSYLAIPLQGRHKAEGAFAAVRVGDRLIGAPGRAVSYNANVWEAPVPVVGGNYTYFVPLTQEMSGQEIDVVVLVMKDGVNEIHPEAWITAYPIPFASKELVLTRQETENQPFHPARSALAEPVRVILDTDNGPDCGDAGAVAVLHALADRGELEILGMMACTSDPYNAPCLDAYDTYYGRPSIPVGTLKDRGFLEGPYYTEKIARNFPNSLRHATNAPDATALYRRLLSNQPEQSVTVISIGPLRNLRRLLESAGDTNSPLSGCDLVARKVKELSCMAAWFPRGREWNVEQDAESAQFVCEHWPTPIMFSGGELGYPLESGERLAKETPASNPVRAAYGGGSRPSWDQTSVIYAARGLANYWDAVTNGCNRIEGTASNVFAATPHRGHSYLVPRMNLDVMEKIIDDLMVSAVPGTNKPGAQPFVPEPYVPMAADPVLPEGGTAKVYPTTKGQVGGGATITDGAAGNLHNGGAFVVVTGVDGGAGGPAYVKIRYATCDNATKSLLVNDVLVRQVKFRFTSGWKTYKDLLAEIILKPGTNNTIMIKNGPGDNAWGVNLESFTVIIPDVK